MATNAAKRTLRTINAACTALTGHPFLYTDGRLEWRIEEPLHHSSGGLFGAIFLHWEDGDDRFRGKYRIEADGSVGMGPSWLYRLASYSPPRLAPAECERQRTMARGFAVSSSYRKGDWIQHTVFGIGRVEQATMDRTIRVLFADGTTRTLAHARMAG